MKKLFQNLSGETQEINGLEIQASDYIEVDLPEEWNEQDGIGEGGPWGYGGYSTIYLEQIAENIERG